MENGRKLGVFDIDGTLFRSSLLIELTGALVQNDIFPKSATAEIERDYKAWLNREGDYETYLKKVVGVWEKHIGGCSEDAVYETATGVLKEEKGKVYRYTRQLIRDLKNDGYFLFAISGSPEHILSSFAKDVGFDYYVGAQYEVHNGKFTGEQPFGNPSWNKRKTLETFLSENEKVSLKFSVGIGDTESDIAFLEMVDRPIAFNPNMKLLNHAVGKNWSVVVERKDVIYDVKDFKILSEN